MTDDYDDAMARLDELDPGDRHFDRAGNPISISKWIRLFDAPESMYQIVRQEHVGDYLVSTVWTGINYRFHGEGPPLIFETMVFKGERADVECERWATEEEAIAGHESLVEQMRLIEAALSG